MRPLEGRSRRELIPGLSLQGEGLGVRATCVFSNQTSTVNVTAVAHNSSTAVCTAPPWQINRDGGPADVSLTAVSGACRLATRFEYYEEPEVMTVWPSRGPRYGSFRLTVGLGASLDDLAAAESVSLSSLANRRREALKDCHGNRENGSDDPGIQSLSTT